MKARKPLSPPKPTSLPTSALEDPYRTVVEDLTETICRFRPDGSFTYVNEVFCRLFGKTQEEVLEKHWRSVVVMEDVPHVEAELAPLSPSNPVIVIENRVHDGAGNVLWMQFVNRGLFDDDGRLLETQSVGRDVTDRVLTEEKLKQTNLRWKCAVEGSGFGLWDWDIVEDTVFYSNEWKHMLGYAESDVIHGGIHGWQGLIHPEDLPSTIAGSDDHLKGKTESFNGQFRALCKDGSWKWVQAHGRVTLRDAKGNPLRMIGTNADISQRKAAEERESNNLQMIVQGAPSAAVLEAIVLNVEASYAGIRCTVMLVDETGQRLRMGAAPSMPGYVKKALDGTPIGPDIGVCGVASFTGERMICHDVLADPRLQPFHKLATQAKLHACWSEPIKSSSGKVLGAFACYRREPHTPDNAEIQVVTTAARMAALALEREKAEQALRESEERYARAMRGTTDGLWDWNIETDDTYFSPRWKEMLGFAEHELPSTRQEAFISRLHPDDPPTVQAARKAHFEDNVPYQAEFRLMTKSGAYKWFVARGKAERNEQGKAIRMTGTISDITERKEAELNYRRELDYNQALVNLTSAFIVVLDTQGRFTDANPAFYNAMGYTEKDVIGKMPWEFGLMDAEETVRSKERLVRLLAGEDGPRRDSRLRTKKGELRTVELRSTSTRKPDGSIDRIVITGTDMTERNYLQQEILRVVEQEQARVGHDLHDGVGQTMTGIIIMMESLEGDLKGELKVQAQRIHELLRESVGEVRRMSHGLSPTSVKYRGLIGALNLLSETVRKNFRTPCICEVDPTIEVPDEDKQTHLFRIAQEAVNNALRHGKPKQVKISLQHVGSNECELRIEDDGVGMKKTKNEPPNGIGVRVMDYRANLIGGRLKIQSRAKKGGLAVSCRFQCEALK